MEEGREAFRDYDEYKLSRMRSTRMTLNEARPDYRTAYWRTYAWDENNTRMAISFLKSRGWRLAPLHEKRLTNPATRHLMRATRSADSKRTAESRTLRIALQIEFDEIRYKEGWSSRNKHVGHIVDTLATCVIGHNWDKAIETVNELRRVLGKVNLG